jgi:DNA-binding HxlR family transcriptional regulator
MTKFRINNKEFLCPVQLTLHTIMGKWKALILWNLREDIRRYGELKKLLPGVTHKMLTQQLRELEQDGIIHRKVYAVVPPKVEYSLTERGRKIVPILEMMRQWGMTFQVISDDNSSK